MPFLGAITASRASVIAAAFAFAPLAGCAGEAPANGRPAFAGEPAQVITTESGALRIAVRFAPQPPVVGQDAAELVVTDGTGTAPAGLAMEVFPWMPAHGHGAAVQPEVIEVGPGVFVADPLYLFMAGSWELRLTIRGAVDDAGTATFDVR